MLRNKIILAGLALAALAVTLAVGIHRTERAPDVALTLIEEGPMALSELYDGRPALVVFWATDCRQCLLEVPALVQLYEEYHPRGLDLVAVAMAHDPPNRVWNFKRDNALPYRVSLDIDRAIASAFGGIDSTPTMLLIDGDGSIVFRHSGKLRRQALETLIRDLLESGQV